MSSPILAVTFILTILAGVNAWGEEGHKIVAAIAAEVLTSNANNLVNDFCGDYTLPDIAPLPDDYDHTSEGRWSAPCHYVDMPSGSTYFTLSDCGSDCCVVSAILNYTKILSGETNSPFRCNFDQSDGIEPCALEFLVHFVGDVHQPLHVGWASDRGGNSIEVYYYNDRTNLHAVWDTKIIEQYNDDYTSFAQELITYINNNPSVVKQYISNMDPSAWANESFQYVRTVCYNYTTNSDGEIDLGDDYYNDNLPIIKQRLVAAGVRLGNLLNTLFTSDYKHTAVKNLMKIKY